MTKLADEIRAQAALSSRPGQMQKLEILATLVDEALAEAWDEGWQTGQLWAFSDLDEYGKHTNPYRGEAQ